MKQFDDSFDLSSGESENIYTVTEISDALRQVLEAEFQSVNIIGEVRNVKQHSSGHIYFTLRDEQSMISAVIFRKTAEYLPFVPEDGESIIASGRITHYGGQGRTQLITYAIVPAGRGMLEIEFRRTLKKLMDEGLTDISRKRSLPGYPSRIAVITSPTGAVIKDIINTVSRRWPVVEIILIPCEVQGDNAVDSIVKAFEISNTLSGTDIVILARGGGSIEDLWAFNKEEVARAVAKSRFPVITGIGHEIDTTIVDYVSDVAAATPTAAAEIATPAKEEVMQTIEENMGRMKKQVYSFIENYKQSLKYLVKNKVFLSVCHRVENYELSIDDRRNRLSISFERLINSALLSLNSALRNISFALNEHCSLAQSRFVLASERIIANNPRRKVEKESVALAHHMKIINVRAESKLKEASKEMHSRMRQLLQLSPVNVLKRGYTVCTSLDEKRLLSRVKQISKDMDIVVNFYDGDGVCRVNDVRKVGKWLKR